MTVVVFSSKLTVMHHIQEQLLQLSADRDITSMRLVELAQIIGVKHLQQVRHHRDQLIKHGLLDDSGNRKETQVMKDALGGDSSLIAIPVLGAANAGPATIYADSSVQGYLYVSSRLLPIMPTKNLFALNVVGRSMNKARLNGRDSIDNGDYVIVDGREPYSPETGDYVVSNINGFANIKRFVRDTENQRVVLLSESTDDYPPIVIHEDDDLAQSKIVQVVKSPKID